MTLSDAKIKAAQITGKRYELLDSDGLYIEVMASGKKHWRFVCVKKGKRYKKTIGEYPFIGLREARQKRDELRGRLEAGTPFDDKKKDGHPFESVAMEWYNKNAPRWGEKTQTITKRRLDMHVLPLIGSMSIESVKTKDLLAIAQRLEAVGSIETTHRVIQACSQIFRYAVAREYCEYDPTQTMRGALIAPKQKHYPTITDPEGVGELLRRIDAYPHAVVRIAMQLSALLFLRPGELRHLEWTDIKGKELRIPAEKMKMKKPHIVPLAKQALALIESLRPLTGHAQYLFPSNRAPRGDRPMSDSTVLVALREIGYTKDQLVAHSFRSTASTLLNENRFNWDWVEKQLAHAEKNAVRAAYNYAEYLPERRKMMQWWADYLDKLRRPE